MLGMMREDLEKKRQSILQDRESREREEDRAEAEKYER